MRRKLLCVAVAMMIGICGAGAGAAMAVFVVTLGFGYAAVLHIKPEFDVTRIKTLMLVCAFAMLFGSVRMALQQSLYDTTIDSLDGDKVKRIRAEVIKTSQKKDSEPKLTVRILEVSDNNEKSKSSGLNSDLKNNRESYDDETDNGGSYVNEKDNSKRIKGMKCLVTYYGNSISLNDENAQVYGSAGAHSEYYRQDHRKENGSQDDLWRLTGCVIEFSGKLAEPESAGNPRCFDYRTYLRSQGICMLSKARSIRVVKKSGSMSGVIRRRILGFREGFLYELTNKNETTEALLRGVLFGDTDSMDEEMKEDFQSNGTAHILAVSGLHIGLLYSVFRMLRKKLAVPGMTVLFLAMLGIYGTMTLWTVSVTRAAAIIVLMEAGDRLDRRFDLLTSLGLVSMLILIRDPYALYSTSFIMSFLSVTSIGMLVPVLKRHLPDSLSDSIKTSFAVQAGLVPFIAYSFNTVPLAAVVINIPVLLILTLIVTVSAAAVPVYLGGDIFGNALMIPFRIIIENGVKLMILINERFSEIEILSPDVVSPPIFIVCLYYGVVFLLCSESFTVARIRKDHRRIVTHIGVIAVVVFLSFVLSVSEFDRADVVMVDVGQGDCMHFRFKPKSLTECVMDGSSDFFVKGLSSWIRQKIRGQTNIMIDGGGSEDYNIGKKTLKPYLLKNGIRKVDLALATHLHTDHYKGIQELDDEGMVVQMEIGRAHV